MSKKPVVALIYDFDKTLATSDMQNFKFIKDLGMDVDDFWNLTSIFSEKNHCERILAYLYVMIEECKKRNIPLTEEYLMSLGQYVDYYEGVLSWFDRINEYGAEKGIEVEHYIISSGNREIIKGTKIANKFKQIFACNYVYDDNGLAIWPRMIVNYTSKTQCLFRISKGVLDIREDNKVNEKVSEKHVEFENMIYIGDGITDVPCMTLVKERNGLSIAVYKSGKSETAEPLVDADRVEVSVTADYRDGSRLDKIVKAKIDYIALTQK